ncbi:peroxiredoxin [Chitinibacter bivalviorum]|uniref:thioredoxin-dependent peroxiredoxin n=1 Tax=Chitinibacter bivalviorum TaxID=2739434 RepID=A0A7H9BJ22_9NEIS|nr:peroxiredoxin [Chitinibacter bivalviorum]QLG87991.1 peroxiredoxin [Chitinibacter bivalviorum]
MLNVGELAPDFSLPDAQMEMIQLSDFQSKKNVVLYFFNKDHTPGGILEAVEFSDRADAFSQYDTVILGVSSDDCLAHDSFIDEQGLSFDLLSDTEGEVSRLYHAIHEWEAHGVVRYGIERSTFVIDKSGVIRHAFYHVVPKGHAAEILNLVKQLG